VRISAELHSEWFHPLFYKARVLFNGNPVKMCIWADEEKGELEMHVPDPNGGYSREIKKGRVFICFMG
jgi:hypothetical protein